MRLLGGQEPRGRQIRYHGFPRGVTIQAAIFRRRVVVHRCIEVEDGKRRQTVTLSNLPVVEVVRRRDFHATGAELLVDVGIGDYRDLAPGQRQIYLFADDAAVALIVRVDRHRNVAKHRLRTRRRDRDVARSIGEHETEGLTRPRPRGRRDRYIHRRR